MKNLRIPVKLGIKVGSAKGKITIDKDCIQQWLNSIEGWEQKFCREDFEEYLTSWALESLYCDNLVEFTITEYTNAFLEKNKEALKDIFIPLEGEDND